jgi:hypothetical protein
MCAFCRRNSEDTNDTPESPGQSILAEEDDGAYSDHQGQTVEYESGSDTTTSPLYDNSLHTPPQSRVSWSMCVQDNARMT